MEFYILVVQSRRGFKALWMASEAAITERRETLAEIGGRELSRHRLPDGDWSDLTRQLEAEYGINGQEVTG